MLAARHVFGGVIARKSGPSSTAAPTLRSSARHRREPIGLLDPPARDVAQRRAAVGEEGERGERHRRVGQGVAVEVDRASGQRPRRTSSAPSTDAIAAPIARAAAAKAMSPWIEPASTPSMRSGASIAPIAAAAMKYDADDASPSTTKRPGERSAWPAPSR
jgi:hypothetical protein